MWRADDGERTALCVYVRARWGLLKKPAAQHPPHLPSSHAQSSQSQDVGISSLLLSPLLARGVVGEGEVCTN